VIYARSSVEREDEIALAHDGGRVHLEPRAERVGSLSVTTSPGCAGERPGAPGTMCGTVTLIVVPIDHAAGAGSHR
jgi:hypothetical protein